MLIPKFKKYRKYKKLVSKGTEYKVVRLKFGFFGLKALSNGRIKSKHIETCRQAISRKIKPFGKLWIRVFADTPVTSIPLKLRMGKGKGNVDYWGCGIKRGQVLFEVSGIPFKQAQEALKIGGSKLPIKTKIINY